MSVLQEVHWTIDSKMKALEQLDMSTFLSDFLHKLTSQRYTQTLIQGNISAKESISIHESLVVPEPDVPYAEVNFSFFK